VSPPFRRVLVANRGEIALRIIRACREMDMETVAVYSDADAGAAHVRAADMAVRLGPPPAAESYLQAQAIVAAAVATGAQAVHPGYGFLAERASFAEAVERAGLAFVGPDPRTIAALGDKLAARRAATAAGVPVVPGTLEPAQVDRPDMVPALVREAERIGFPLLVKAAAGGGGRGMRRVDRAQGLPAALAAAARESAAVFGDGAVYLEREIAPARHVEVQLLGDTTGAVVALGERDCTIQRRHQKLVEEAPAPGLTPAARRKLHELAAWVAGATGLRNAGTAEFLLDGDGAFWFLEVNTRLQVEHGITELVTGLDIVREQFLLAAGNPLSAEARAVAGRAAEPGGHAIEVRIAAEDPAREFIPTPGRIGRWRMPSGPGVRIDTATEAGDRIPPEYDNLIAKLMVHAADRPRAIERLRRALDEVEIGGIQTTLPFHRAMAADPAFAAGSLSTGWVAERWDGPAARATAYRLAAIAAGLATMDGPGGRDAAYEVAASVGGAMLPDGATLPDGAVSPDGASPPNGLGQAAGWRNAGRAAMVDRWPAR
jgi:acetyl/propionyl-CoA carboxylase alpha subunit